MARGAGAIGRLSRPGFWVAMAVLALCLGPLVPLILRADGLRLGSADLAALRFTLVQAALSALISVALGVPLARALARAQFRGRGAVLALLGAPFILPTLVAVFGLVALFGRQGPVNLGLAALGLPPLSIWGLHGVVLAHVVLNLPLATRLILIGWQAIPAERVRLALNLGVPLGVLERPMLAAVLPGALAAIFLICLTSFAVALIMGGGPAATTLELAIYQALRFDFDPGRAAALALTQVGVSALAAVVLWRLGAADVLVLGARGRAALPLPPGHWDGPVIALGIGVLAAPLTMAVWAGLPGLLALPPGTGPALTRSLGVAIGAALLAVVTALLFAARGGRLATFAALVPLGTSALALGAGLVLLLAPMTAFALPLTALVNALFALPFAFRAIAPLMAAEEAAFGRLADSLGVTGLARLRLFLPRLRAPMGFAAGLTAAFAVGDLGVLALFAAPGAETLPLLMQRLMGAYQMQAAAGVGLVMALTALALFAAFDHWGRRHAGH